MFYRTSEIERNHQFHSKFRASASDQKGITAESVFLRRNNTYSLVAP